MKLNTNPNFSFQDPFSAQLKQDVYDLCQPEGRMVGTAGHAKAETFLQKRLEEVGCQPYAGNSFALPYSRKGIDFTNLIGVVPGIDRSLAPILIGAHYDSVIAAPCADDNGAAVAICLGVAQHFATSDQPLDRDLVIAIFDAEEPPYFLGESMGSHRFYHDQLDDRGVHFALIQDLVGHDVSIPVGAIPGIGKIDSLSNRDLPVPFLKSALFAMGCESHPALSGIIQQAGVPDGIKLGATLNRYIGDMSDHAVFRKNGIPYLFLSCGWWAHYHMPTDTPDRLNYNKMAKIAELSWKVLRQAADGKSLTAIPKSEKEADHTLEYEIRMLKSLAGQAMPLLLKMAGLKELKSRRDIEALIDRIVGLMLSA